jgi:hypothetical protein
MEYESITILEIAAEGGSFKILRLIGSKGKWCFIVRRDESAMADMLSEEDREGIVSNDESEQFDQLDDALKWLDKYPWWRFYPQHVHPEFVDIIKVALKERWQDAEIPSAIKREWVKNCSTTTTIIGIDCATQPKKVGLALCKLVNNRIIIDEVRTGADSRPLHQVINDWIPDEGALLAMDAPLGWPQELATTLVQHNAGQALSVTPDKMFRRMTDDFVWEMTGKKPMEVGAERIARTAHAALRLLEEIGLLRGKPIPLCWSADKLRSGQVAAIEVYPAGVMAALGVKRSSRDDKIAALERLTDLSVVLINESVTDDIVDAALCAVAAADFLQGNCYAPSADQLPVAKHEGWIWVRQGEP